MMGFFSPVRRSPACTLSRTLGYFRKKYRCAPLITKLDGSLYTPCKNPSSNHGATATFQNPKGGNTKRNDKAGKFWVGVPGGRGGRVVDS